MERQNFIESEPTYISQTEIFLLAGGKGSRLKNSGHPELASTVKPLVLIDSPRGRVTMLDNAVLGISETGLLNITLLTSSDPDAQGDQIEGHARANYQDKIKFSREEQPLGTAGAVYNAFLNHDSVTAAIVPVDTLFPFESIQEILDHHKRMFAAITWIVTTQPGENAQNTGRILVNPGSQSIAYALEGMVNEQVELLSISESVIRATSVGVIVADRKFYLEQYDIYKQENNVSGVVDLYRHFIPWLLAKGATINAYDIAKPAPDLGTLDRLTTFARKDLYVE